MRNSAVRILLVLLVGVAGGCSMQSSGSDSSQGSLPTASSATATAYPPDTSTSAVSSEGPGSHSHDGDAQFCSAHACIANFANGNGYVVQCADGNWSHSGGLQGACSDHGGEVTGGSPSSGPPSSSGSDNATSPGTASGVPSYGSVQDLPVQCGYGVAGSAGVSCAFAENAFYEYWHASGGNPIRPESIEVWSAEAQQSYPLLCSSGSGVVDCTGTNSSGVSLDARFNQQAVSAYTSAEAGVYAASGKLGPSSSASSSTFTPGDQNPHDASASSCESTMEVGPHSDCALAQQVAADLAQGVWSAPGSDTVSEGGNTVTFSCSVVGTDYSQSSQPSIYSCVSQGDPQDWFKFAFT